VDANVKSPILTSQSDKVGGKVNPKYRPFRAQKLRRGTEWTSPSVLLTKCNIKKPRQSIFLDSHDNRRQQDALYPQSACRLSQNISTHTTPLTVLSAKKERHGTSVPLITVCVLLLLIPKIVPLYRLRHSSSLTDFSVLNCYWLLHIPNQFANLRELSTAA
jgi:hypothetical protein